VGVGVAAAPRVDHLSSGDMGHGRNAERRAGRRDGGGDIDQARRRRTWRRGFGARDIFVSLCCAVHL
jgi:hypothetical protein